MEGQTTQQEAQDPPTAQPSSTNFSPGQQIPWRFDGLRRHPPTELSSGVRPGERGHSLRRIQPMSRHSGNSVSTFFNGLFTTIIGISTLGASITFSYVISNNPPPPSTRTFGQSEIQLFLSISWFLFLLALAFASLGSTLLTFFKEHWKADWDCKNGEKSRVSVQVYAACASGLLSSLVVSAFVFLCLVVIAYSPVIGWLALGFTTAFGLVIAGSVLYQAPWPWRNETLDAPAKSNTTSTKASNSDNT